MLAWAACLFRKRAQPLPPQLLLQGLRYSKGPPPSPHCCGPVVSQVLGRPAIPVAVPRSSTRRGEWVLAWAASPGREHSPSPLSFCGRVFPVSPDPSLPPLPLQSCLLGPGKASYPSCSAEDLYPESAEEFYPESAEEFHPERWRWAGANARISPTT